MDERDDRLLIWTVKKNRRQTLNEISIDYNNHAPQNVSTRTIQWWEFPSKCVYQDNSVMRIPLKMCLPGQFSDENSPQNVSTRAIQRWEFLTVPYVRDLHFTTLVSEHLETWTYATSRYSVIGTGHLGTRYWIIKIIWLNLILFTCRRCFYKFLCFFLIIFLIKWTSKRQFINICK